MVVSVIKTFLKMNVKSILEFRLDFLFRTISMICSDILFFGSIAYLAYAYDGFLFLTYQDIITAFAIAMVSYFFGINFFKAVAHLQPLVIDGDLDKMLIRPISLYKHILIYEFNIDSFADFLAMIAFLLLSGPGSWPFIIVFGVLGAIILHVSIFLLNLFPFFFDMNTDIPSFDLIITFIFNPPVIFNPVLKFIAYFILPGGLVGFVPMIALYYPQWWFVYFFYLLFITFFFFIIFTLAIKKYRSAGY